MLLKGLSISTSQISLSTYDKHNQIQGFFYIYEQSQVEIDSG